MASLVLKTAALATAAATSSMQPQADVPAWAQNMMVENSGRCSTFTSPSQPNLLFPGLSIVPGGLAVGDWGVSFTLSTDAVTAIDDTADPYEAWIQLIYTSLADEVLHTAEKSTVREGANVYAPFAIPAGLSAQPIKVKFHYGATEKGGDQVEYSTVNGDPSVCNASYTIAKLGWGPQLGCELNEDEIADTSLPKCPSSEAIERSRPAECYVTQPADFASKYETNADAEYVLKYHTKADVDAMIAAACPANPAAQNTFCQLPGCVKGACTMTGGADVGTCNCAINNPNKFTGPLCGDQAPPVDPTTEEEEDDKKKGSAAFGAVASAALALVAAVAFF